MIIISNEKPISNNIINLIIHVDPQHNENPQKENQLLKPLHTFETYQLNHIYYIL